MPRRNPRRNPAVSEPVDEPDRRTPPTGARAYVGLGSSLGNRAANLQAALNRLASGELEVTAVSPVYGSAHLGAAGETRADLPPHLNAVARVCTSLPPLELLKRLQAVEAAGGRARAEQGGPRSIDLDLLLYDDRVIRSHALVVPHPRMAERRFVLQPLADLEPDLRIPSLHPVAALLQSPVVQRQRLERAAAGLRIPGAGELSAAPSGADRADKRE